MPKLRLVVFQEDKVWIAQCLEHDISVFADSMEELQENLLVVLDAEANESMKRTGEVFGGIPPAPREFFDKWDKTKVTGKSIPELTLPNGRKLVDFTEDYKICA